MLRRLAAQLEKCQWQSRIEMVRNGPPASSCAGLAFYEDDTSFIRYRKMGNGPSIVFLCDGPATLEAYDHLFSVLAESFTVIAFETPGNGFSIAKPGFSFDFQHCNDALARFLNDVAGEQSILAFSCGGAYAAIDIAGRYPELCSQLVIIQAPSWKEEMRWKKHRDPRGLLSTPFLGQMVFPRMMKPRAPAWYELSMANTPAVKHLCDCTTQAFEHGATFALPTLFQNYLTGERQPFDIAPQPALAIWGMQDGSHVMTDKQSSRSLARQVQLVKLDHVGHFPELEDPTGFRRLLDEFVS